MSTVDVQKQALQFVSLSRDRRVPVPQREAPVKSVYLGAAVELYNAGLVTRKNVK